MSGENCTCMECRVRKAISGNNPAAPFEADLNEVLNAVGNILGEVLAHAPTKTAKMFCSELLEARKRWQKHPRVMAQAPAKGSA